VEIVGANMITTSDGACTVAELHRRASQLGAWAGSSVVLASDDPFEQVVGVLGAAKVGYELAIVPSGWLTEAWVESVNDRFHLICRGLRADQAQQGGSVAKVDRPGLAIFTSGSTRAPTPVSHAFARLNTFDRVARVPPNHWLVAYRPGSYAWTQVVMLGLLRPGQSLHFARSTEPAALIAGLRAGVSAVSSTPSFWRYLLVCSSTEQLRRLRLRQLTLGGEPVDQALLDRLRAAFPETRITHVYASTECGVMLSCSDGKAGFPLGKPRCQHGLDAPAIKLCNGTLHVRSPYSAAGDGAWIDTQDLADLVDGRLYIRGRRGHGIVNVGGQKVSLTELESVAHEIPGVVWARAHPVPSAIVGSVVGLEVVLEEAWEQTEDEMERRLRAACRRSLGEHAEPRLVRFVAELPLATSLKAL
jgi:acyl-coenzyme A synthetase/AMP-(fatty) acid ligase